MIDTTTIATRLLSLYEDDEFKEKVNIFKSDITDEIKENPQPWILGGVGFIFLFWFISKIASRVGNNNKRSGSFSVGKLVWQQLLIVFLAIGRKRLTSYLANHNFIDAEDA